MPTAVRAATPDDAAGIARVHVDTWRTTYRGVMDDGFLASLSYDQRQRDWEAALKDTRGQSLFVAEDDHGNVVGFAACGPTRDLKGTFEGELYAIYVVQSFQGKGTGKSLVLSATLDLEARGFHSMLVWVLEASPFRSFYEKLGGELVAAKYAAVGGRNLKELGLGWKDLRALATDLQKVGRPSSGSK